MNKTAIKNFAMWARNKLIADISYKAGLLGVTEKGIKSPLPQSTQTVQFFDIGTKEPSSVAGVEIQQRKRLVEEIERKAKQSDYATAYKNVLDEVAYTWFNRLIAIRFMEVNDYLPTRIRVLSSESNGKAEPDLVTHALEANLDYSAYEKDRIIQMKNENKLDDLFRMLLIKQCNVLNSNLPELFEKTSDYTELLLNVSFTDKEGVVYHLINDIDEDDFNVSKEGQVEIIGWLYQYYNTEPKDETFALLKKNVKITKERIPAATQLFTPDWIVRYMVENSLGRLWLEGHPNDELKSNWKYYLDEAEQEDGVKKQLEKIREEYKTIKPEDLKVIDPAMGSGHILVYAFDVLMQIYESNGYSQRDAAKNIIEKNLYGLDIDNRAYQLAYFAVMMKARQYNRRILNGETICHLYSIKESNDIDRSQLKYFGAGLSDIEKNTASIQLQGLLDTFTDAKEYGSILNVENYNWELLRRYVKDFNTKGQLSIDNIGVEETAHLLRTIIDIGELMSKQYDVVITNPPYLALSSTSPKLYKRMKLDFPISCNDLYTVFIERCHTLTASYGYQSMVTQHNWMFLSRTAEFRKMILQSDIISLVHLGTRAFEEIAGEVVQTAAFTIRKRPVANYSAKFIRLVDFENSDKKENEYFKSKNTYKASKSIFRQVPGDMIIYWQTNQFYKNFNNKLVGDVINTRVGLDTGNNDKYIRMWHEVTLNKIIFHAKSHEDVTKSYKWVPHTKGGSFRKWYGNFNFVLVYDNNSYTELLNSGNHLPSRQFYFMKGITWSRISTNNFAVRYTPNGMIFNSACPTAFAESSILTYALGLLNSKIVSAYVTALSPTMNFQVGEIDKVPFLLSKTQMARVVELVEENIRLSKADWDSFETSWDFLKNPLVTFKSTIRNAYDLWESESKKRFYSLKSNEEELNDIFISIYSLENDITSDVEESRITVSLADVGREIRNLISYSIGCIFGRYSLDHEGIVFAGGVWDEAKYVTLTPDKDNIIPITDEQYLDDDIVALFIEFVKKVYGQEALEENLDFIAYALGNKGTSSREAIRSYFIHDFFKDHCSAYSVTGSGKRPIYWLFDSGKKNGFKALIYMHRYDENTIGNLRIDYLHRMQRIYENEIARMQDTIENSKDAREVATATKRKEKLIKQLQETKEYDEKIAHLALARTSIDLDDGVKVNYEKVQTDRDGKKLDVLAKI